MSLVPQVHGVPNTRHQTGSSAHHFRIVPSAFDRADTGSVIYCFRTSCAIATLLMPNSLISASNNVRLRRSSYICTNYWSANGKPLLPRTSNRALTRKKPNSVRALIPSPNTTSYAYLMIGAVLLSPSG